MRHVLEHFVDPLSALNNISNHTRRYLAVEVPGIVDKIPSIQQAHIMYFSLNTLPKLLSMAGFRLCNIDYFRSNNFIMSLFEKVNDYHQYSYDHRKEYLSTIRLWKRERARYLVSKAIKVVGLYNLGKTLKSYICCK